MTLEDILREPEFMPFVRRWFFDQLTAGLLSPDQIRDTARRLDLDLFGPGYALALLELPMQSPDAADYYAEPTNRVRNALLTYFMKYSEYEPFPCGPELTAVLIQGTRLPELIRQCVETVRSQFEQEAIPDWHIAVSSPVRRLEALPGCWQEVRRLWAWRSIRPELHVLEPGMQGSPGEPEDERALLTVDPAGADPAPLRTFLATGRLADTAAFADRYLSAFGDGLAFLPLRHFIVLSAWFAAEQAMTALGLTPRQLYERLTPWTEPEDAAGVRQVLEKILRAALVLRDETTGADRPGAIGLALGYISDHIDDPDLSLSVTGEHAGLTGSYLSTLFRQELDCTFTSYVREKRLDLARRLLRTTDMPVRQVSLAAGYRDSHYFSALFKKHIGCTPSEYRTTQKDG